MDNDLRQKCDEIDVALKKLSGSHGQTLSAGIGKMLDYIYTMKKSHIEFIEPVGRLHSVLCSMGEAVNGAEVQFEPSMKHRVDDLADKIGSIFGRLKSMWWIGSGDFKTAAGQLSAALDKFGDNEFMSADRIGGVVFLRKSRTPTRKEDSESSNNQLNPDETLANYPRFRILVIGKTGTGKSTLINQTFNVKLATAADYIPGKSDINKEIRSPENNRFILHDSMGFEAGEHKNLGIVTDFIRKRNMKPDLPDKIHAVWLCLPIPYAGGRLLETGDEKFLKLDFGLPVVAVFTKLDIIQGDVERAVRRHPDASKWSSKELQSQLDKAMDDVCEERCAKPLQDLGRPILHTAVSKFDKERLKKLVQLTYDHVKLVSKTLSQTWAVAQRANVDLNIRASIKIGGNGYWSFLATSLHFRGKRLEECLVAIHDNIADIWNFLDPHKLLRVGHFRERVLRQVEDFDLDWLCDIYKPASQILRVLMGYIVDLTLILDSLFLLVQAQPGIGPHQVTGELVDQVIKDYGGSKSKEQCHLAIKEFVKDTSLFQRGHHDRVLEEITKLIRKHRSQPDRDLKEKAAMQEE